MNCCNNEKCNENAMKSNEKSNENAISLFNSSRLVRMKSNKKCNEKQ